METPALVVSDPPHGEVDLQAAADLLGLDIYLTRLKVKFRAPEVLSSSDDGEATEFAAALRATGLNVSVLPGTALLDPPWPDPVSNLVFDESAMRGTVADGVVQVPYQEEVVAICCQPPEDFSTEADVDLGQAIVSGHGPTVAKAIQFKASVDLYFTEGETLRRVSIVPEYCDVAADSILSELERRFRHLHLDTRLVDVRPRQPFIRGEGEFDPDQRKRYSYGTLLLCHVLESISPGLRDVPQFELGSRLGYALSRRAVEAG